MFQLNKNKTERVNEFKYSECYITTNDFNPYIEIKKKNTDTLSRRFFKKLKYY